MTSSGKQSPTTTFMPSQCRECLSFDKARYRCEAFGTGSGEGYVAADFLGTSQSPCPRFESKRGGLTDAGLLLRVLGAKRTAVALGATLLVGAIWIAFSQPQAITRQLREIATFAGGTTTTIAAAPTKEGAKSSSTKQANTKIDRLIQQLGKWDGAPDRIPEAANMLVKMGEPAIVPLINNLASKDIDAELWSGEVLKIVGSSAVPHLIAALNDKDVRIRSGAAAVLGEIGDTRAVKPLIALLSDQNPAEVHGATVTEIAEYSLGQIGDRRAVGPLISLLKDTNEGVRYRAALALEEIGDERALEPLIDASELEKDSLAKEQMANTIKTLR